MVRKKKGSKQEKITDDNLKEILEADEISDDVDEFISTGSTLLDFAIANRPNGGIPVGRITELSGNETTGKSLLCLQIAANAQKKKGIVVFIDTEHDLDKGFAIRIGIDWDRFVYKEHLACLEDVFNYIDKVISKIRISYPDRLVVIIWDSIASTPAGVVKLTPVLIPASVE